MAKGTIKDKRTMVEKASRFFLYATLFFAPFGNQLVFSLPLPHLMTILTLVLYFLHLLFERRWEVVKISRLLYPATFFLVSALISVFISCYIEYPGPLQYRSVIFIFKPFLIVFVFVFIVLPDLLKDDEHYDTAVHVVLWSMTVCLFLGIIGFFQSHLMIKGNPSMYVPGYLIQYQSIPGEFGDFAPLYPNRNILGEILIPGSLWFLLMYSKSRRIFYLIPIGIFLFLFVFSYSKSSYVAMLCLCVVLVCKNFLKFGFVARDIIFLTIKSRSIVSLLVCSLGGMLLIFVLGISMPSLKGTMPYFINRSELKPFNQSYHMKVIGRDRIPVTIDSGEVQIEAIRQSLDHRRSLKNRSFQYLLAFRVLSGDYGWLSQLFGTGLRTWQFIINNDESYISEFGKVSHYSRQLDAHGLVPKVALEQGFTGIFALCLVVFSLFSLLRVHRRDLSSRKEPLFHVTEETLFFIMLVPLSIFMLLGTNYYQPVLLYPLALSFYISLRKQAE